MRRAGKTSALMKILSTIIIAIIPFLSFSQDCENRLKGTFSVGWGTDSKQYKYAKVEAGIWKGKLTLDLGLIVFAKPEDTTGLREPSYVPTQEHFATVYLKAGLVTYRSETGSFINVLSVNTMGQVGYSFYVQPSPGFLIGLTPFYSFSNKGYGGFLTVRVGMN